MDLRGDLTVMRLDNAEQSRRRDFFELHEADLARPLKLRQFAEKHTDAIVEGFYQLLLGHPETKKFFEAVL